MSCREARYTRFYLDFFKFNEDEAHETPVLTVPPVGSPSTKVVSLDDILGADLVNKENIVKQPLAKQTRGVCASSSPFPFVEKMEHLFSSLVFRGSGSAATRLCAFLGRLHRTDDSTLLTQMCRGGAGANAAASFGSPDMLPKIRRSHC